MRGDVVAFEDDVTLWGRIIAAVIGGATLIGTLLSVGREWTGLKWRVRNLEGQVDEMRTAMLQMQEQASNNVQKTTEAAQEMAVHAATLRGNVELVLEAVKGLKSRVTKLEQGP